MERRAAAWAAGGAALLALAAGVWALRSAPPAGLAGAASVTTVGEARAGAITVSVPRALPALALTEGRTPGRPIVVLDPGHGGSDPGAIGTAGALEKTLTLAFARELRDRLAQAGRVRVALTRDDDRALDLATRAALARQAGAAFYLSIHIDSAPNPLASGATAYSLSEVASDRQAAALAASQNRALAVTDSADSPVRALLSDLALRDQMEQSAELAERVVRLAGQRSVPLRPEPHRFADFHVLRRSQTPAVLFEAGYISNAADEARLATAEGRAPIVAALAAAIEAEAALVATR